MSELGSAKSLGTRALVELEVHVQDIADNFRSKRGGISSS